MLGNTPPRREAREGTAESAAGRAANTGRLWDDSGVNPTLGLNGVGGIGQSNQELFAQNCNGLVFDARGNGDGAVCPTVTGDHAGRPTDYTPVVCRMTAFGEYETDGTASTMKQRDYKDATDLVVALLCVHGSQDPIVNPDHANAIGRNHGAENCVCQYGNIAGSLTARHDSSPCADRGMNVVAIADVIHGDKSCNGKGWNGDGSAYTLDTMATQGLMQASCVRRLTPVECERLMGFQDNWTRIPWRGKPAADCPDGPRYKACGNSMGINVMRWIGRRIEKVEGEKNGN